MVQKLNMPQGVVQTQGVGSNQPIIYYCPTKPMKSDSFNGKTLLTVAGLTAAVIFRKKIGNIFKNLLPNSSKGVGKDVSNIFKKNKDNFIIKGLNWVKTNYLKFEDWCKNIVKDPKELAKIKKK